MRYNGASLEETAFKLNELAITADRLTQLTDKFESDDAVLEDDILFVVHGREAPLNS